MRFKRISELLACSLIFLIPIQSNASAADEIMVSNVNVEETVDVVRAKGLITTGTLSCSSGNKTVYITAATRGSEVMSKIGFKNIEIQRSSDKVNWTTEKTVPNQLAEDTDYNSLSKYSVTVNGGYYYRVVLDHYAKEDTWWFPDEQSVSNTSNSVWVP